MIIRIAEMSVPDAKAVAAPVVDAPAAEHAGTVIEAEVILSSLVIEGSDR